jgi:transposase InsO family protein/transposase-like protein
MSTQPSQPTTRRTKYTEHTRAKILDDAYTMGTCAAADKHGVPRSTVSRWRTAKDRPTPKPQQAQAQPAPSEAAIPTPKPDDATTPPKRKVVKRYTPSQRAEAVEYAHTHGVAKASNALGMSRFSLYQWMRKSATAAKGETGGKEAASTAAPSPTGEETAAPPPTGEETAASTPTDEEPTASPIETQRDLEIIEEYKRHPGLGPSQIRNQLRRKNVKVSVHTVRRVMEEEGYRPPKVERVKHDKRFEAVRPNHMWHLDFVARYINRAKVFTLILIDDHSRYVVGHAVDDAERADMVISTFEEAVERHGKPEIVMHDRGSAFWSWRGISRFTALLAELGIDQYVAKEKEHNGKVEAFNGNLHKELFDKHRFYDVTQMARRLASHLVWYNRARTHHSLGGLLVPADRYFGRADEVLARIEAGAGPDEDLLAMGARRLSLFSITSKNGEVEVCLMGQRLSLSLADADRRPAD